MSSNKLAALFYFPLLLSLGACTKGMVTQTVFVKDGAPAATAVDTSANGTTTPTSGTAVNGDGFGGGGKALGKLEAARLLTVSALRKLKMGLDSDWLCQLSQMNSDQQDYCRAIILDNIDELVAMHTTAPVKFEVSLTALPDGLMAKTSYGPDGSVIWTNALVIDEAMTTNRLVKFILHESLHKLVKYLRDDDQPVPYPAANGGRVCADNAGDALVAWAASHLTYVDYVTALNPLGYWRMNDKFGDNAADVSGHGLTGTPTSLIKMGNVASPLAGNSGNAPTFTLSSGNINVATAQVRLAVPTIPKTVGTAVTVSFWMKWSGMTGIQGSAIVFGFSSTYNLIIGPNKFGFNTAHGDVLGVTADLANRWVHVVAVFNNGDLRQKPNLPRRPNAR